MRTSGGSVPFLGLSPSMKELGLTPLSEPEIELGLGEFDAASAVTEIAALNMAFQNGGQNDSSFLTVVNRRLFGDDVFSAFFDFSKNSQLEHVQLVHSGHLRLLLKLAWRFGQLGRGRAVNSESDWRELGRILLSLHDVYEVSFPDPLPSDPMERLLVTALEFEHNAQWRRDPLRAALAKSAIVGDLLKDPTNLAVYKEHVGTDPPEAWASLLTLVAYFMQARPGYYLRGCGLVAEISYLFGQAGISPAVGDKFISDHTWALEDRERALASEKPTISDFGFLLRP